MNSARIELKETVRKLEREKSALAEELKMECEKSRLLKEAVAKLYEQHSVILKFLDDVESDDLPLEQRNRRVKELAPRFIAGPTAPPDDQNAAATQQSKELESLSHHSRKILGDINYDTEEEHDIEEDEFRKTPLRVRKRK